MSARHLFLKAIVAATLASGLESLMVLACSPIARASPLTLLATLGCSLGIYLPLCMILSPFLAYLPFGSIRKYLGDPVERMLRIIVALLVAAIGSALHRLADPYHFEFVFPLTWASNIALCALAWLLFSLVKPAARLFRLNRRAVNWLDQFDLPLVLILAWGGLLFLVFYGFDAVFFRALGAPGAIVASILALSLVDCLSARKAPTLRSRLIGLFLCLQLACVVGSFFLPSARFLFATRYALTGQLHRSLMRQIDLDSDGVAANIIGGNDCAPLNPYRGPSLVPSHANGYEVQTCAEPLENLPAAPDPTLTTSQQNEFRQCIQSFLQIERPHVVFLSFDALRADTFQRQAQGQWLAFFEESVVFEKAYAPSSRTDFSVPALFSGMSTSRLNNSNLLVEHELALKLPLLGSFQKKGYRRVGLSLLQGAIYSHFFDSFNAGDIDPPPQGGGKFGFYAGGLTRQARRQLANPPAQGLFLWVHHLDVHAPVVPISRSNLPKPDASDYERAAAYALLRSEPLLYDLMRGPRAKDTIVVVTADHGDELGEAGRWGHGDQLLPSVLRVPLVIRVPGCPAAKVDEPVSLIEVAPAIALLTHSRDIQWSLLNRFTGGQAAFRPAVGAEVYHAERLEHFVVGPLGGTLRTDVSTGGQWLSDEEAPFEPISPQSEKAEEVNLHYRYWLERQPLWHPR